MLLEHVRYQAQVKATGGRDGVAGVNAVMPSTA